MSAITDSDSRDVIKVLFTLHQGFDLLDFAGPLETFGYGYHDVRDLNTKGFECSIAGPGTSVKSSQGVQIKTDMDFEDALEDLDDFDILVVTGGNHEEVLKNNAEPIALIKAWAELQQKDPTKERTLMSICTGSFFLAEANVLGGFGATTHPKYYTQFENVLQRANQRELDDLTDVMEERYVVNNARYDLGENLDENPFVSSKRPAVGKKSAARKGSMSWKESKRRESVVKRAQLKLGGLRVITTGGITCGIDATLYLIAALISQESAEFAANILQYTWQKGVTIDGIDV